MPAYRPAVLLAALLLTASCGDDDSNDNSDVDSGTGTEVDGGAASCGDGVVNGAEECDDGNAVDADGCDSSCRFNCLSTDTERNCALADECAGESTCNDETHVCSSATPLPDNESCAGGPNNYCLDGVCTVPVCGNGRIEPGEACDGGEDCENCQQVCTGDDCESVCGDRVRQPGEQCDDGNQINLDGCDSACQFEQAARISSLQQQFTTDDFCRSNALGDAITPDAQSIIQATWDVPVQDGSLSVVFKFLGLTDLSGQNSKFTLGFVNARAGGRTLVAKPACGNGVCEEGPGPGTSETAAPDAPASCPQDCTYDGNADLDWWYLRDPASVDETETPIVQLSGQINQGVISAGPGTISLKLLFAFEPAQVTLRNAVIAGPIDGPVNAPAIATGETPPGHLPSENLSPEVTSFASASAGSMCSDVSVASLYDAPMPALLQGVCTDATGGVPAFTAENRLLDAFLAGCLVFGTPGISPTQPDGSSDGAVYRFTLDEETSTVSGCTRNGEKASLQDCLNAATYSSYFKFSTNRVIIRRE